MAAGDFSASTLATVIERSDILFHDERSKRLYEPKSVALQEIVKEQTADVSLLNVSGVNKVRIAFLDTTAITANDCAAPTCTPTGVVLQTQGVEYTLDQCAEATAFSVEVMVGTDPSSIYANGIIGMADVIAKGMLKQKKELEEKMAAKAVALTVAKAGVNADTYGENGSVVVGTNTTIPAVYWTPNLFPYFQQEAELNRFSAPYLITGRNLYLQRLQAIPNQANANQKSEGVANGLIETAYDPFTFGRLALDKVTLLIDAGAIAFAARNVYSRSLVDVMANTQVFSTPSISFPGVVDFDVTVTRTCSIVNNVQKWFDVYQMKAPMYNIIANPANGLVGNTGVLKFTQGA